MLTTIYKLFLLLSILTIVAPVKAAYPNLKEGLINFGPNKPHMLFHVGTRDIFSVNYGCGYWQENLTAEIPFSSPRLRYENTDNGLYLNMESHDGQTHVHQSITDSKYSVKGNIYYQLLEEPNQWQQEITLTPEKQPIYWYTFMTVENNDPDLIDKKGYATPISFQLTRNDGKSAEVLIKRQQLEERIQVRCERGLKVFGLSMNISESFDTMSILKEFQTILQIKKFKDFPRTGEQSLQKWEDTQVELIRENDFFNKKYVVLIFYAKTTHSSTVFITNGTESSFDSDIFRQKSQQINEKLFTGVNEHQDLLRHMLFNLYGGLAFYIGKLYTQNSLLKHELDASYSFTPSRLIFPRGFLWDDGFHMSVSVHHNALLTMRVLRSWLRKIDLFGWIGREQIRGLEMTSLMPDIKFVFQDIFEMNPPTMLIPLLTLVELENSGKLTPIEKKRFNQLLDTYYWRLEKWFRYLVKTQTHSDLMEKEKIVKTVKYRWRCKDQCEKGNFMGSGLDDYPRINDPTQISKQHVDLLSWVYFFADALEKLAQHLHKPIPENYYRKEKQILWAKVIEECLDSSDMIFKDLSVHSKTRLQDEHISKNGYISLFPFMTGMLISQKSPIQHQKTVQIALNRTIQLMLNESELLSEDGLRSLSISDEEYGTSQNYWRGAVWMPINYMVLRACKKYYWGRPQVDRLYDEVRSRLIRTVRTNWEQKGYLFENYHEGQGHRGFPFYGWTTLLTNIITELY